MKKHYKSRKKKKHGAEKNVIRKRRFTNVKKTSFTGGVEQPAAMLAARRAPRER